MKKLDELIGFSFSENLWGNLLLAGIVLSLIILVVMSIVQIFALQ